MSHFHIRLPAQLAVLLALSGMVLPACITRRGELSQPATPANPSTSQVERIRALEATIDELRRAQQTQADELVRMRLELGTAQALTQETAQAQAVSSGTAPVAKAVLPARKPRTPTWQMSGPRGPAYTVALMDLKRGRVLEARDTFRLSASLNPEDPFPLMGLAICLEGTGQGEEAARARTHAIELAKSKGMSDDSLLAEFPDAPADVWAAKSPTRVSPIMDWQAAETSLLARERAAPAVEMSDAPGRVGGTPKAPLRSGMTREEVRAVLGDPSAWNEAQWYYDATRLDFVGGRLAAVDGPAIPSPAVPSSSRVDSPLGSVSSASPPSAVGVPGTYVPPVSRTYRTPVAENGDVRGFDNDGDGRTEPVHVRGYFRKDGTYVQGHYRARPRR